MIRFFENINSCHIVIDSSYIEQDNIVLLNLLNGEYISWHVEFVGLYSVNTFIIETLYNEIFINKKDIVITAHKSKLSRYFHRLGFKTSFDAVLKNKIIDVESIEIVLIGGSAYSSQKIVDIVKRCSFEHLSLVVVQHVDSKRVGKFDEILQKYTSYSVSYAKDGEKIEKSKIYIAPNNRHLKVRDGCFVLNDDEPYNFAKPSISLSYESFSNYYKESLLAIQECGYASDGVDKFKLLKTNSSKIIVQSKGECEAQAMVINAFMQKAHDYLFHEEDIIDYINFINKKPIENECIDYLLSMIHKRYGYDFSLYHGDMVKRRVYIFMVKSRIKSIKNAVGAILFNKSIFKDFFLEVSINVTEFFRAYKSLKFIKEMLENSYKSSKHVKIWSAGCSSGKEALSIAILLDSIKKLDKSIIYATDFNNVVLQEAKNGFYSLESYDIAKKNLQQATLNISLDDYFIDNNKFVSIKEFIKEKILFFEHNLVTDSSFNEFDIIVCSNVIIYFNDLLQQRVFKLFYDSLKFGGYLILGEKELIHNRYSSKFERYNNESKIFRKVA